MEAFFFQGGFYFFDLLEISRLNGNMQEAPVNGGAFAGSFMIDARYVSSAFCNDLRNGDELPGFIDELDIQFALPSAHQ